MSPLAEPAMRPRCLAFVAAVCMMLPAPAWAVNPAEWIIDETVDPHMPGGVTWTSPTAIDLGFDLYEYAYDITTLEADAGLFGSIDLKQFIDAPLADEGETDTLPVVLLDEHLMESIDLGITEVTVAADVFVEIDNQGFAQLRATNIDVPSVVDTITVRGTVNIEGFNITPGDYDRDGMVGAGDYDLWRLTYGSTENLAADGVADGVIDARDYAFWRDQLTQLGGQSPAAVPEPAGAAFLALGALVACRGRRVRSAE